MFAMRKQSVRRGMCVISGWFAVHVQHRLTKKFLRFTSPSHGAPPAFNKFDPTIGWYPFRTESEMKSKCLPIAVS